MYITRDHLLEELGAGRLLQLADPEATGEEDPHRIRRAIEFAEGTFNSYARTRYAVPVAATEKVRATCIDLAVFVLERPTARTKDAMANLMQSRHDPAMAFLKALKRGEAALDVPTAEETVAAPQTPDRVLRGGSRRSPFDDTNLRGF